MKKFYIEYRPKKWWLDVEANSAEEAKEIGRSKMKLTKRHKIRVWECLGTITCKDTIVIDNGIYNSNPSLYH